MSAGDGRVAVIGLGLMGGSMARDLAARGRSVRAYDVDPAASAAAENDGVVRAAGSLAEAVTGAELVVVATPVAAAARTVRELRDHVGDDAVITDLCSTKRTVVEAAEAAGLGRRFVASHPMAGDHRSGWSAAREGLFEGATVWLCAAAEAAPGAVETVEGLWRELGASPVRSSADEHDRLVAWASHLPQVAASALAAAMARGGISADDLGPGGRDATRLAAGDPGLWTGILADNADEVGPALLALIHELIAVRRALFGADDATVRAVMEAGRDWVDDA